MSVDKLRRLNRRRALHEKQLAGWLVRDSRVNTSGVVAVAAAATTWKLERRRYRCLNSEVPKKNEERKKSCERLTGLSGLGFSKGRIGGLQNFNNNSEKNILF